jgi:excisionase family DNA binding protein
MMIIQLTTEELQTIINTSIRQALAEERKFHNQNKQEHEEKDLLNVKETAELLNLTIPTIYSKVNRGELPYMKKAKRLYFSKKELLDFLKSGRVKTEKELDDEAEAFLQNL